ncbi:MAG: TIGR03618 family F420-dependent PPOX class oxidoreductase [Anaerolineales bacterium]|nr:TIGR03618 family F420-dependent PPOX class oxidoreductase [Anaerolineales bacterium]
MREVKRYPQVPGFSQEELSNFLNQPLLARLSTLNPNGTIHTIPIWYEYRDGIIFLSTQTITQKVKNIERQPQVTVLVDTNTMPYKGVMIYGTAELDFEDAVTKRVSIFERYIGSHGEAYAHQLAAKWEPVIIQVTPTRIVSFDYTKGSLVPNN